MSRFRSGSLIVLIGSVLFWPACGDGVAPLTTAYLEVTVDGFPPDGFRLVGLSVSIDDDTHPFTVLYPRPRLVVTDLAPGDHALTLAGVPSGAPADCAPEGATERTLQASAGGRYFVEFDLACTWGTLRIETTTTGVDLDADGYSVEVTQNCYDYYYDYDGCESTVIPVPINGTVIGTIAPDLSRFTYQASLVGVAANCVTPDPQAVDYPAQATVAFTVTCTDASASRAERGSATTSNPGG